MSSSILVKICGITRVDDARFALEAGADWIGLNLVAGPRKIDLAAAADILSQLDDRARAVALVVVEKDSVPNSTLEVLKTHGVRRLQLYGDSAGEAVRRLADEGFESILVHPVADEASLAALDGVLGARDGTRPNYVLFDSAVAGQAGGTGRLADWNAIASAHERGRYADWPPMILGGGLTPGNVAQAVRTLAPFGVDVSSGVESAPGCKDHARVREFVAAARGGRGKPGAPGTARSGTSPL